MKSTRFVFGRALAVLCALLFVSFGFMSCQQEDETEYVNYSLTGTWQSSYGEIFKITSTSCLTVEVGATHTQEIIS